MAGALGASPAGSLRRNKSAMPTGSISQHVATEPRRPAGIRRVRYVAASYRIETRRSYLVALLILPSFVVPSSFVLPLPGSVTITRVCLAIAMVVAAGEAFRKLTRGGFVLVGSDLIVPLMCLWMVAVCYLHDGAKGLIGNGAITAVEFLFSYWIARTLFGTPAGLTQFARVLQVVVVLMICTALLDTLTGKYFIAELGRTLSRTQTDVELPPVSYRMGLARAMGSLEHPILLGVFFADAAVLLYFTTDNVIARTIRLGLCLFGTALAMSSAPFLGFLVFLVAAVSDRVLARFRWKWALVGLAVAYLIALFCFMVDDPLAFLIKNFTFDPQTGKFRLLIWQWVGVNMRHSPWIGIGFDDWMRDENMPTSVDSLWLLQALRYGYPATILLGLALLSGGISILFQPTRRQISPLIRSMTLGANIVLFVMGFLALTVHFWGATWDLVALVIGIRAGLTESGFLSPAARGDDEVHSSDFYFSNLNIETPVPIIGTRRD